MRVVYAKQEPPESWHHAIFLAGPTPRDPKTPSWRPEALEILEGLGYEGVVFVPEPENGEWRGSYTDQTEWEKMGLEMADKIVFWVPRDLRTMPALTTNIEYGRYVDTGKAVLGYPDGAEKMRYLDWLAGDALEKVPVRHDLTDTLKAAILLWDSVPKALGDNVRSGGERWVPRVIFETPMFQSWYTNLREVGNRLDKAQVLWTFGLNGRVFSYVLKVDIWVASEGRHKANEWVFARTDVACVVLYHQWSHMDFFDTEVVLIREFRSPARTPDGFIHEVPGGGVEAADDTAKERAAKEVYEETGLVLRDIKDRLRYVGSRQAVGTVSTHQVHVYGYKLTADEMAQVRKVAASGEAHGEDGGEEQTYVEWNSLRGLMREENTDWATLGLIFRTVMDSHWEITL